MLNSESCFAVDGMQLGFRPGKKILMQSGMFVAGTGEPIVRHVEALTINARQV